MNQNIFEFWSNFKPLTEDKVYHYICDMYLGVMADLMEKTKNYVP